jgi:hypothetical protein
MDGDDLYKVGNSLVATELAELQTTHENSRRYTEEIVKNTAATSFMGTRRCHTFDRSLVY